MAHPSAFVALFVCLLCRCLHCVCVCEDETWGGWHSMCETKGQHMSSTMWNRSSALATDALTFAQ